MIASRSQARLQISAVGRGTPVRFLLPYPVNSKLCSTSPMNTSLVPSNNNSNAFTQCPSPFRMNVLVHMLLVSMNEQKRMDTELHLETGNNFDEVLLTLP